MTSLALVVNFKKSHIALCPIHLQVEEVVDEKEVKNGTPSSAANVGNHVLVNAAETAAKAIQKLALHDESSSPFIAEAVAAVTAAAATGTPTSISGVLSEVKKAVENSADNTQVSGKTQFCVSPTLGLFHGLCPSWPLPALKKDHLSRFSILSANSLYLDGRTEMWRREMAAGRHTTIQPPWLARLPRMRPGSNPEQHPPPTTPSA